MAARTTTMAKSRYDSRGRTAPQRSNTSSRKSEKWEVMRGWVTPADEDDSGIAVWSKARIQAEEKARERKNRRPLHFEPYLGGLSQLCCEIQDVRTFKENSKPHKLIPKAKPKDINNNENKEQNPHIGDKSACVLDGGAKTGHPICSDKPRTKNESSSDNAEKRTQPTTSASAKGSKASHPDDRLSQDESGYVQGDQGALVPHQKDLDSAQDVSSQNDHTAGHPMVAERSIKLSYTQSHIKLRNPYNSLENAMLGLNRSASTLDQKPKLSGSKSATFIKEDDYEDELDRRDTHSSMSGFMVTSLQDLREKVGSPTDNTFAPQCVQFGTDLGLQSHSQPNLRFENSLETDHVTSIALINDGVEQAAEYNSNDAATSSSTKKCLTQKQVSLLLKKVTQRDTNGMSNGFAAPDVELSQTSKLPASFPTSANRRQFHTTEKHPPIDASMAMAPSLVGDLLPIVEHNFRSRTTLGSRQAKEAYEDSRQQECPRDSLPDDRLIAHEESLLMLREGVELLKLNERQQTMLGPPAFKPVSNKTPLQRAKENTSKRLFGQSSYINGAAYSDISKSRWVSTNTSGGVYPGTRYNGILPGNEMGEDVRSAPVTGRLYKRRRPEEHKTFGTTSYGDNTSVSSKLTALARRRTAGTDFRYMIPD